MWQPHFLNDRRLAVSKLPKYGAIYRINIDFADR